MTRGSATFLAFIVIAVGLDGVFPQPVLAQATRTARLVVTVVDPAGAMIPNATVRVIGLEAGTRSDITPSGSTAASGIATFEALVPGRYSLQAESAGFDLGLVRDIALRAGDNRRVIVLPLRRREESVSVAGDRQEVASSRASATFGVTLTAEQIEALSDDPAELARQIADLAGGDAIIRVDSFEGQELPPKSQIKSIHVIRDQYAAESAQPGTFVDVVTQPGIGPLSGGGGYGSRAGSLDGRSPFVNARGPEQLRTFNANIGGTIIPEIADFSFAVNGRNTFTTPIVNQTGAAATLLRMRQPNNNLSGSLLLNYAVTRDQTLRFGVSRGTFETRNEGVGGFDSADRAFSSDTDNTQVRIQQAGPLGRRTFINTRLSLVSFRDSTTSAIEAPTIVIQDGRTTGGAQTRGSRRTRNMILASDVDYVRGIHSWRAGILVNANWTRSDAATNYLGTYTFADQAAFDAGRPILYTRNVGNPSIRHSMANGAVYLQDDIRVRRGLTLSPGVRYSVETRVRDYTSINPRFGMTWSPAADGRTTLRASVGLFDWFAAPSGHHERTVLFNGEHQRQVIVRNPSYPDPGTVEAVPPTVYVLGPVKLQTVLRYSAGVERVVTPRLRVSALYAYYRQFGLWSFENLNAPVNGVRPDPTRGNVVQARTDARVRRHDVALNASLSMLAPSPATNRMRFHWRRVAFNAAYAVLSDMNSAAGLGPFVPPASGTNDTEWGPAPSHRPFRVNLSIVSTQLQNLNVNLNWVAVSGAPYSQLTGFDDNGDGFLNDRPAGVGKNSLQMPWQSTVNLRAAYTLLTAAPAGAVAGTPAARRYRIGFIVNVTNLTNHANYGGFSGVMTSSFFMQPSFVLNPRRVDMGINIGF